MNKQETKIKADDIIAGHATNKKTKSDEPKGSNDHEERREKKMEQRDTAASGTYCFHHSCIQVSELVGDGMNRSGWAHELEKGGTPLGGIAGMQQKNEREEMVGDCHHLS